MPVILGSSPPAVKTYLQLVNRAMRECNAGGVTPLTTLQSGLSVEAQNFANWVNEAGRDIQQHKPDWEFMRVAFDFVTTVGQGQYTITQLNSQGVYNIKDWKRDSFRCYADSVGTNDEQILPFMEWSTFRNVYLFGSMRQAIGRPSVFSIDPDKNLYVGARPDVVYDVVGEFYTVPLDLVQDADDPFGIYGLPAEYHMMLVYGTMMQYGTYYAANEVFERGQAGWNKMLRRLEFAYLPTIISGPPLA